jgi:protein tyrosine phosphatase (PTP) superfamily phosphohydrolase (DUF442 family)
MIIPMTEGGQTENTWDEAEDVAQAKALRIWRAILIAALVIAAITYLSSNVVPNVFPKRFDTVAKGQVYRSGKLTPASTESVVKGNDIKTIIDLGAFEAGSIEDRRAQETAESLGVTRYRLQLWGDATGNPNTYLHALRLMTDPANQPVLVHCGAGTERTGCAVMLYRQIVEGVGYEDLFDEAVRAGHDPDSNEKLRETYNDISWKVEQAFRDGGWIPGVPPPPAEQLGPVGAPPTEAASPETTAAHGSGG